jgi:hypothetical protein
LPALNIIPFDGVFSFDHVDRATDGGVKMEHFLLLFVGYTAVLMEQSFLFVAEFFFTDIVKVVSLQGKKLLHKNDLISANIFLSVFLDKI